MPVQSPTKTTPKRKRSEKFVPQTNQDVLYEGKVVTVLWEVMRGVSERTFKVRQNNSTIDVPLRKLSRYTPIIRVIPQKWAPVHLAYRYY
jgi:hypothetical protein